MGDTRKSLFIFYGSNGLSNGLNSKVGLKGTNEDLNWHSSFSKFIIYTKISTKN